MMVEKIKATRSTRRGFTIVELLIVIVVIAILAAITIVAYNGIQNRAKTSAAVSATTQATKKISLWQVDNPSQSPDLGTFNSIVGTTNSGQYQYTPGSNGAFCVTATVNNLSYYQSNSIATPAAGACPGHGVNGVPPVINYVTTPYPNGSLASSAWTGYNSVGGDSTSLTPNALGTKDAYRRSNPSSFAASSTVGLEYTGNKIPVPAGASVYPSIFVRSSKAGTFAVNYEFRNSAGTVTGNGVGPNTAVPANTWTRLSEGEVVAPAGTDRLNIRARYISGASWVSNEWIEVTQVSTAPGAYADGDSPNWIWTSTPNASTSTGPQL